MNSNRIPAFRRILELPSRRVELLLWALVVVLTLGIRFYLIHLLPVGVWSGDTGSYANTAFRWVHTGVWETDPRRGPIYSLLIAFCCKVFGTVHSVMVCQHLLGALGIFSALAVARIWLGQKFVVPLVLCGIGFGLNALPISLEHLFRNETLLFLFGLLTFASWLLALHRGEAGWLWITGISVSLLTLTKNVYVPFPLVLVAGHLYFFRTNLKAAARQVAIFLVAFAIPVAGVVVLAAVTPRRLPEPQAGLLFYGRTAQFTMLDGGKYPELKAAIRQEVEDYRRLPKLDNNIILKRTVVPHLWRILQAEGKHPADLNHLCWELGVEAVKAHPAAYVRQVFRDLNSILFTSLKGKYSKENLSGVLELVKKLEPDPLIDVPGSVRALDAAARPGHFRIYNSLVGGGLLFRIGPSILTTLLLLCFIWSAKGAMRLWWLGLASVWFFNVVLLCTVGRPLGRYMIPVMPVMFWPLTAGVALLWEALCARVSSRDSSEPLEKTPDVV